MSNVTLQRIENEEMIICCALRTTDNDRIDFFTEMQDVYINNGSYRSVFNACKKIYFREGFVKCDLVKIETENRYNELIDNAYNASFTCYNWSYYVSVAKKYYMRDGIEKAVKKINFNDVLNVDSQADNLINEISEISTIHKKMEVVKMNELCKKTLQFIDDAHKNKTKQRILTGIESLDEIIYDLEPAYYIIGARTSLGKSALSWSIATSIASQEISVLYFSLEMSPVSLAIRETAMTSGVKIRNIKTGFIDDKQLIKVMKSVERMSELNLSVTEGGDCDISSIVREIRRSHFVDGVNAFFIDHISLLKAKNLSKKTSFEKYEEISALFQNLQRELNIYIFAVAQLGRGTEGKEPSLADIRGSGAFEQDADIVLMIHRNRVASQGSTDIPSTILVQKNRNGQTGVAPVMFTPSKTLFRDMNVEEKKDYEAQKKSENKTKKG